MSNQLATTAKYSPKSTAVFAQAETEIGVIISDARSITKQVVVLLRERAFRIGEILERTKQKADHGDYEKWVKRSTLLPMSTAQLYCNYYTFNRQIPNVRDLPSIRSTYPAGKTRAIGNSAEMTREEIWQYGNLVAAKEVKPPKEKAAPKATTPEHIQWRQYLEHVVQGVHHLASFHEVDRKFLIGEIKKLANAVSGTIVIDRRRLK